MGNKLGRRRQVVDEKYTRPQGLYQHTEMTEVDHKNLRKLILDSKLAPCYPGDEECTFDLEECPICFLYYPSLNRSRCCMKGICTECYLQMKPPHSTRPPRCPFCKTSNYAVDYRGMRSEEEKGMEQIEEQRVIEAKIRIRQKELQDEEERIQSRQEITSSSRIMTPVTSFSYPGEGDEIISSQDSCAEPTVRQLSHSRQNREDQFDVDLEDIMMMEAIWLSIQGNDTHRNLAHGAATPSEPFVTEDHSVRPAMVPLSEASSPSGGLACAIAALAERQHMDGDSTNDAGNASASNMLLESSRLLHEDRVVEGRAVSREDGDWGIDHGSEVAEAGTSYASSDVSVEAGGTALVPDSSGDWFQPNIAGSILPDSFEEQMMLAMAVSLVETRSRTNAQGVA